VRAAALVLAAAALAVVPASAQAKRSACHGPKKLSFDRKPGAAAGRLSWRPLRHAPRGTRYRVYRDTAVIGQTRRSYMRVRVSVGRRYWLKVRPVTRKGRLMRCWGQLDERVRYALPKAPGDLAVTGASGAAAHLAWSPGGRGDARVVAYRVLRDGATFKQTRALGIDVPIANDRTYSFSVLAVDAHGKLSEAPPAVSIESGHQPPPAPGSVIAGDISDSELTLSWAPSVPARGRIAGYRVYRDGKVLRQVQGLSTRVTNLAAGSSHEFTVAAVDSAGWLSAPSAPAAASTAPPVPTTGKLHAFLLASTDRSFADFRAHYRLIGTVYPTFFDCSAAAELTGADNAQIVSWARARAVKVMPRFNCQRSSVLNRIVNDAALRSAWLDQIVSLVEAGGYDGANLDFEAGYATDRSAYTSFVTELAARLHARGKLLSLAVSAKSGDVPNHPRSTFFDYQALAQQADTIFVMAWGIHWQTSAPGAQDDMRWLSHVVAYIDTIGQPGRFVLGMQLYGMDWPAGGGTAHPSTSYEYSDLQALIARVGATPTRDAGADAWNFSYADSDGVSHDVWYTDSATEAARAQLARDHGIGVGFWRLGNEDQRLWERPEVVGRG
jgi:spore germination protein YaaH